MSDELPASVPHCSDTPGIDTLWESEDNPSVTDYSFRAARRWTFNASQSESASPMCNKYKIACSTVSLELLIVLDCHQEFASPLQTLLTTLLALIESQNHRVSLLALTSSTIDTFQYHLPLASIDTVGSATIENVLAYMDQGNGSIVRLDEHLHRISDYLLGSQSAAKANASPVILTISSRLDVNQTNMNNLTREYSSIRYMTLDPRLRMDEYDLARENALRSLTSSPLHSNLFWSYAANRDLTFNTVFRLLEALCGYLR